MIQLYNTLSRTKEELVPRHDNLPAGKTGKIQMFVCGPTVYDYIHIGNARTFVFFDVVAKYLKHKGYDVDYIQNITDIDDKIIKKAKEENKTWQEVSEFYFDEFKKDVHALGIDSPRYIKATDRIEEVKKQVKTLKEKEFAYLIENDGWYFELSKFPEYGKLSNRTAQMANDAFSRIDDSAKKKNPGDFCLWKLSGEGEKYWEDEELGNGRPGWHIEDTAITETEFGPQYDIHGGGQDLMFPHHEAEIAQQESASGKKPFVKYWVHVGFLVNKEQKMSKSLGNFMTLREALKKYPKEVLRFYFLMADHTAGLAYEEKLLNDAQAAVNRIADFLYRLSKITSGNEDHGIILNLKNYYEEFEEAMDDDINTAKATGIIFTLIRILNKPLDTPGEISKTEALEIRGFFNKVNVSLGIIPKPEEQKIPEEIKDLTQKREQFRKEKKYSDSDKIRAQIQALGWEIEDTLYGPLLVKK